VGAESNEYLEQQLRASTETVAALKASAKSVHALKKSRAQKTTLQAAGAEVSAPPGTQQVAPATPPSDEGATATGARVASPRTETSKHTRSAILQFIQGISPEFLGWLLICMPATCLSAWASGGLRYEHGRQPGRRRALQPRRNELVARAQCRTRRRELS
jgi:hypothetical protein